MPKLFRIGLVAIGLILVTLMLLLACFGDVFIVQAPYYLVAGWIYYLGRVVPQIRPDPAAVGTGVVCLAAVTLGCHWFARWLHGSLRPGGPAWSLRWTGRVVAVIVLMFVAGTAAVGIVHQTTWLATSKERLIDGGMRPVAARSQSNNNLKQMALAAQNVEEATNFLPRSTFAPNGKPMHSWQTSLLPFIEQDSVYRKFNLSKPWDHSDNLEAINTQVKVFLHPGVDIWPAEGTNAITHYAANVLTLGGDRPRRLSDFEKGSSNTLLIGEAVSYPRAWADPLNWRDPRLGLDHPRGFGGPSNQKVTQFVFADGSVRTIDARELAELLK